MCAIPGVALLANYYLNFQYYKLWGVLDPPKPDDDDELTQDEVSKITKCDHHFDAWNHKYAKVATHVKRVVACLSHKFFQMPYTHFFGYQHLTLRIQDDMQAWQWELADWRRYLNDTLTIQ